MPSIAGGVLLDVWDHTKGLSHPLRAVAFCALVGPQDESADAIDWSLGRRDARVLQLRHATFGPTLRSKADCPACAATVEFDLDIADLVEAAEAPGGPARVTVDDWTVDLRPPTSRDLLAVVARPGPSDRLLERCLASVQRAGAAIEVERLPADLREVVAARMLELDPLADISLDLRCAECGVEWQAPFDIVTFFGEELGAWAQATLGDVHTLARAYGWSEPEILALSPSRRRAYLELALS